MRSVLVCFLAFVSFTTAFGQIEGNPENWCRQGFFTRDTKEFSLGTVKVSKGAKAFFYNDFEDNCPGSPSCREKAYLINGNEVVINRVRSGFACAWYEPIRRQSRVGWIKESDLGITKLLPGGYRSWLGEWTHALNGIEFTENKLPGFLNVTGNATWKGLGDNVDVGEIDGRYEPKNGVIEYSDGEGEYDCRAALRLLGKYLIVADNLNCGGVNVSFSEIYIKRRR